MVAPQVKPTRPGDPCRNPACQCSGVVKAHTTRINFVLQRRVRYLHCPICGWIPDDGEWIVPLEHAPPRQ